MHSKKTQKNESTETEDDRLVENASMLISIEESDDITNNANFNCDERSTEYQSNHIHIDTEITYETHVK